MVPHRDIAEAIESRHKETLEALSMFVDGPTECIRCGKEPDRIAAVAELLNGNVIHQDHYVMCKDCAAVLRSFVGDKLNKRQFDRVSKQ